MSQASTSLPLIDISPFVQQPTSSDAQRATAAAIHESCLATGFFYLSGHGIPDKLFSKVLDATRTFLLESTDEEKAALSIESNDFARGYQRKGLNVTQGKPDWHEALDLYAPSPYGTEGNGKVLGGENRWPVRPAEFKAVISEYVTQMIRLGDVMVRATGMGLGLNSNEVDDLAELVRESFWVMRCIGYPPLPINHDGVSCGAHKDYGCYTFLHADSTRGALQVFKRGTGIGSIEVDGEFGFWIDADPIKGALVVNIGEMWEIWTNGLYKATLHRVIHKGQNYRVSVPFFYEPAFEAHVTPLPAVLPQENGSDESTVVKKPSVKYGDFLLSKVGGNFMVSSNKPNSESSTGGGGRSRY